MWNRPPINNKIKSQLAQRSSGRPPMIPTVPSDASAGSAPTSVMCLPSSPLTRDLSDLSGSYMNGNTAPRRYSGAFRGNRVPTTIGNSSTSEASSVKGPWRQAYVLSSVAAASTAVNNSSGCCVDADSQQWHSTSTPSALIVVERNGVVELVKSSTDHDGEGSSQDETLITEHVYDHKNQDAKKRGVAGTTKLRNNHPARPEFPLDSPMGMELYMGGDDNPDEARRIPLIILLMDPGRKLYELMQLWVDVEEDTVRDVLHAVQHKLSDKWRQDYDGLFQVRSPVSSNKQHPTTTTKDNFCQLVHILPISKYDVQPKELWVAKPWSMAAKSTIEHANDCIRQLRAAGLLTYAGSANAGSSMHIPRIRNLLSKSTHTPPDTDAPLTLSNEAMKRLYAPDGILKHHHACQFLTFLVPGAPSITNMDQVVANSYHHHHHNISNRLYGTSLLGTGSFDESSQLSNPSDVFLLPHPFCPTSSSLSLSNTTTTSMNTSNFPHLPQHEEEQDLEQLEDSSVDSPDHDGQGQTHPATSDEIELSAANPASPSQDASGSIVNQKHVRLVTTKNNTKKRSVWIKIWNALFCRKRRSSMSVGKEDGYSSSSNGKCSSHSSKNIQNNNLYTGDNESGRSTPDSTSKGSAGVESILDNLREAETLAVEPSNGVNLRSDAVLWAHNLWNGITPIGEEGSIVSDSAPLLVTTRLLK